MKYLKGYVGKDAKAQAYDFVSTKTPAKEDIKVDFNVPVEIARKAAGNTCYVALDVGPLGELVAPLGKLTFDEAYEAFSEVVKVSRDKVDGYILETFSDLYELKACVLAVKENSDKRVFATMTFDSSCRTLTGTTPEIAVNTLEGLGAIGVWSRLAL